jgi:putative membrane protein
VIGVSPSVSLHTLVTAWQTSAIVLVALLAELAAVAWYVWSTRRLRARGRAWSGWRTASFIGGVALVVVAVQSGVAAYSKQDFWIYVIQHLLLMNGAPILLALGAPVTLALQASQRTTQRRLLKVLHHPVVEFVTNPVVIVTLAYGTMLVYFLTPFYRFALAHPVVLELTHLHFLVSGCLFWWLVVGVDPSRWRLSYSRKLAYLAVGIPVNALLGLALTGATVSVAPASNSVADTHLGGAILWIVGELITLVAMGIVVFQWMRYEEREAVRADRAADAALRAAAGAAPPGAAQVTPDR